MSAPDQLTRLEVFCPGGRYPIGGGMTVNQPPGLDGEGIYPHSFERLGAQRGFHISEVLYDSNWASTTPRNITIQAVCARGQIPQNPTPHKTVFILPGQTKSAIARCPKRPAADHRRLPAHQLRQRRRQLRHRVPRGRDAGRGR